MLDYNFQIAAVCKLKNRTELRHIEINNQLRKILHTVWQEQFNDFNRKDREIDFVDNPHYKPEEGERFRICPYPLPLWLEMFNKRNIAYTERLTKRGDLISRVIGIVVFCDDTKGNELILFQNIPKGQIIEAGGLIAFDPYYAMFRNSQAKFLRLGNKLDAIYSVKNKELLFDSFYITKSFLPMDEFYRVASDKDILKFFDHMSVECKNIDAIISNSTISMRKRFAALNDSRILDILSVNEIKKWAAEYNINILIRDGKIIFPSKKSDAINILKLLSEEIFRSPFTGHLYEINSKIKTEY